MSEPTHGRIVRSFREIVNKIDTDWHKENEEVLEFEFSNGRKFYGRYKQRGPYAPSDD
jgi:hypothetical protein